MTKEVGLPKTHQLCLKSSKEPTGREGDVGGKLGEGGSADLGEVARGGFGPVRANMGRRKVLCSWSKGQVKLRKTVKLHD